MDLGARPLCRRLRGRADATGQMNLTKLADSSPFALELLIPDVVSRVSGVGGHVVVLRGWRPHKS